MNTVSILRPSYAAVAHAASTPVSTEARTVQTASSDCVDLSSAASAAQSGKGQALNLLGAGVMMGSIMVGAGMGTPYGPAVMIVGMFAGAAIASLGRDA